MIRLTRLTDIVVQRPSATGIPLISVRLSTSAALYQVVALQAKEASA
jgi:hypothetical protein